MGLNVMGDNFPRGVPGNRWLYFGVGVGAGLVLYPLGVWLLSDASSFFIEMLPHVLTAVIVLVLVDRLYFVRHQQNYRLDLRPRLLQQVAGQSNHLALHGIKDMRMHGWLAGEKGMLAGADLSQADLHDIDMSGANLTRTRLGSAVLHRTNLSHCQLTEAELFSARAEGAVFIGAQLDRANLFGAKLGQATFREAQLCGADLSYASLETADFSQADLTAANLLSANLRGAAFNGASLAGVVLTNADLLNADLTDAQFDTATTLPDGTKWSAQADLGQFTDSAHPRYWRSGSKLSPAYHGNEKETVRPDEMTFDIPLPKQKPPRQRLE